MDGDKELEKAMRSISPIKLLLHHHHHLLMFLVTNSVHELISSIVRPPELQFLVKELLVTSKLRRPGTLSPSETSSTPHTPEPPHTGPSAVVPPLTPRPDPYTPEPTHSNGPATLSWYYRQWTTEDSGPKASRVELGLLLLLPHRLRDQIRI